MRVLSYQRARSSLVNGAIAYPQGIAAADVPGQAHIDATCIDAYGLHAADPISDLLVASCPVTGFTPNVECSTYAELMVANQKDPREAVSALQVKAIRPDDARTATTWSLITKADISRIANVAVGYPGGTGFAGTSPEDDYYIEGRSMTIRPLNPEPRRHQG